MIRHTALFFVMLTLLLFATGCWNRRELNDLAIVTGIAIDKIDNKYHVSVQVVDPGEVAGKKGSSGRAPVTLYDASGDTVFEVIRRMTTVSPRKLYFSHLRIFVLSEELAREGIGKTLDFFARDHEVRTDFYIVVSRGRAAKDIISILTPLEKNPSTKMFTSLEVSEKAWAPTVAIQLDELISDIVSEGKEPILTGIYIKGNSVMGKSQGNLGAIDAPANLQYGGIAVFKKDRMIAWLNEEESKGVSDLTNRLDSTVMELACGNNEKLGIEVIRSQTKVKGRVKDGKPEIEVTIRREANIGDVECQIDLTKSKTLYDLEKAMEQKVKSNVERALRKAKKLNSDIFGFGEAIHRADPNYWQTAKKDWDKHFPSLPVQIKVDAKIRQMGTTGDSFLNKLKE